MIGYGNSMFLATHGILARTASGGGFDPDAQAFITAASITNPTQQSAINQLVVDLKGYNIWTKMKALYPFVGGTAAQHKWNLKDPRDLDAAFRLVFNGGWTHSSTGATPNGTNGFADTFLTPSTSLSQNSTHLSFYSRSNNLNTNWAEMGVLPLPTGFIGASHIVISLSISGVGRYLNRISSATSSTSYIPTDARGLFISNRSSSTQQKVYRNGLVQETANVNSDGLANLKISIGAVRINTASNSDWSNRQCAFASIGDGLTDTEAANLYTAVQNMQITLSRQV